MPNANSISTRSCGQGAKMSELRVAVVEDNERYRSSLERLLSLTPGFSLAAAFGNAEAALHAAACAVKAGKAPDWDIILMDLDLPRMSGVEAIQELKHLIPGVPIVVLTVFEDQSLILEAISAGADGYLLKRTEAALILKQIGEVSQGGSPLTASVARKVLSMLRQSEPEPIEISSAAGRLSLTDRQRDVLRALVEGRTYKEIATQLDMSLDTVRTHIRAIYERLEVTSARAAVSKAIRKKLV